MESCVSVEKLAETILSTANVLEIKPFDLSENLESESVGVEFTTQRNVSVLLSTECCSCVKPTEMLSSAGCNRSTNVMEIK